MHTTTGRRNINSNIVTAYRLSCYKLMLSIQCTFLLFPWCVKTYTFVDIMDLFRMRWCSSKILFRLPTLSFQLLLLLLLLFINRISLPFSFFIGIFSCYFLVSLIYFVFFFAGFANAFHFVWSLISQCNLSQVRKWKKKNVSTIFMLTKLQACGLS